MRFYRLAITIGLTIGISAAFGQTPSPPSSGGDFFEKHIRPILVDECQSCHGSKKQMSGLRLDSRDAFLKGGDNGPVIKPGDVEASTLIHAIRQSGDLKMPPKKKLSQQQVDALAAWIKDGAKWPDTHGLPSAGLDDAARKHWAFQPIKNPPLPEVKFTSWWKISVDRFILAKLEAKGLMPSPPADRRTLLRRVTFDLIGLPPTPEETAAFENDSSPDAYARVVDRLLASPHYGERWGRHWLDIARYSDTKGYVFFEEKEFPWAWTYRDYVIRAFNDDLPYNRFVLEQLAADKRESRSALPALGFLTLGGRFMNNMHDILDDRIDVVTRGLLGLTVTCARCHDHKFDPIPTKDYYSLYGVFASCQEPTVPPLFADPPKTDVYAKFETELKVREKKLADFVQNHHAALVRGACSRVEDYMLAAHALKDKPDTENFMIISDGGDLNPTMTVRWKAYLDRTRKSKHPVFIPWHRLASVPEKEFASRVSTILTELDGSSHPVIVKALIAKPPQSLADVAKRYGEALNTADNRWLQLARASLRNDTSAAVVAVRGWIDPHEAELRQVFHGPDSPPNWPLHSLDDLLLFPDRASQGKLQEFRKAVEQWRATGAGAPPRAMVLEDAPKLHDPRVFVRGSPNNLGEAVPRRFLSFLSNDKREQFHQGSGRLELARAIVDPKNPLTARVIVNRIWLHHFGVGLVKTPSDFGLRSEPPSHPELLDYLATFFMENGWSIKKLHRLIVLSNTYQQQSDDRPECRRIDPENSLLWRMNRQRLDFETTRDALLAVSGMLDRTVGGPSVKNTLAIDARRRTIYGHLDRLNVPGLYRTFDFPNPDATSPQRDQTTVAPQALFLMNHPFVMEIANRVLQRSELAKEPDVVKRTDRLYGLLYSRVPTAEEIALAREYLDAAGNSPAAWMRYVQGLLLANEFVFVD